MGKEVLRELLDRKKVAVLQALLNSKEELYLKEIAERSQVAMTSTFRIVQELVAADILRKREWKTSKVYTCHENSKVVFLRELLTEEFDGVQEFVQAVASVENIKQIIIHGERKQGRANVLVIGQDIPPEPLETAREALQQQGFELSYLPLTEPQYQQMTKMGLYAGKKEVVR